MDSDQFRRLETINAAAETLICTGSDYPGRLSGGRSVLQPLNPDDAARDRMERRGGLPESQSIHAELNKQERAFDRRQVDLATPTSTSLLRRQKSISLQNLLRDRRRTAHEQSADLFDVRSPMQRQRRHYQPLLPDVFEGATMLEECPCSELEQRHPAELQQSMPNTFGLPYLRVTAADPPRRITGHRTRPLRVGLVLSGGPAPGGHNVIAGVYDYIRKLNIESQLYGFLGGLDGLFKKKYVLVDDETMDNFRNSGGFDMLWSGRGRIDGEKDMIRVKEVCCQCDLHSLIIVGGDGSNSNAAVLAEYFASVEFPVAVVGIPKTIDGDLRNPYIETSFGFDTAAKTYSELIGNLTTDIGSAQSVYHFVRVMGRSASHLVLECALQTRPNLVFIGEEVAEVHMGLRSIVAAVTDLIQIRLTQYNKRYGLILVPEGLIEFIPEIKQLLDSLNSLLQESTAFSADKLSPDCRSVWDFLPAAIQDQLLGDREATGYIQVAKLATERLLIQLVETELLRRGVDSQSCELIMMPHYFGYEGRCAMPSNFDANYCYALGFTAACLIEKGRNGYMAVVRGLDQPANSWQPAGVPFVRMMEIKQLGAARFPAVIRQLVDLEGPLFKVFSQVREKWKFEDCYRVPGPIQFEGPCSDIADYTVKVPSVEELLWGPNDEILNAGRAVVPKRFGTLSPLQRQRLQFRPRLPTCMDSVSAGAVDSYQFLPPDPYTHRQILLFYPHISSNNHFMLKEIRAGVAGIGSTPRPRPMRVGIVFLSRQSPGILNILWGLHSRSKLIGGKVYGFYGMQGLVDGSALEICDDDMQLYMNQGGCELLGRSQSHVLLQPENQQRAMDVCRRMEMDGLVIVGSNLALTEATLLAEFFLAHNCSTRVIGVPATGSNNLTHDLIETNIGFDTSSKVYASLIGNVLTDAASMPKYWHFIRLMGRAPSYEVLECALQTHPNFVIIAEEYGKGQKSLSDVVSDIADVVCSRHELGKNFGTVLIPDGLLSHLPGLKPVMVEISRLLIDAEEQGCLHEMQSELENLEDFQDIHATEWIRKVVPWNLEIFRSLPKFIRKEMLALDCGEMRFTRIETERLLAQMVKQELDERASRGEYKGKFATVTHFFGYQGRSALPSVFDAKLAHAYGTLAHVCVESGLTAYCCTLRGLCGSEDAWHAGAIPFNCMMRIVPAQQEVHHELAKTRKETRVSDVPIVPSSEVDTQSKAYRWMKTALMQQWMLQDRFCNPGPIQFAGVGSTFYNRVLHEEQADYYQMVRHVTRYANVLKECCTFGVDRDFLRAAYASLNSLLVMRFHKDDLVASLPPVVSMAEDQSDEAPAGLARGAAPGYETKPSADVLSATSERGSSTSYVPFSLSAAAERGKSTSYDIVSRLQGTDIFLV